MKASNDHTLYPEWPHIGKVVDLHAEVARSIPG